MSRRESLLVATLMTTALAAIATVMLSLGEALRAPTAILLWLTANVVTLVLLGRRRDSGRVWALWPSMLVLVGVVAAVLHNWGIPPVSSFHGLAVVWVAVLALTVDLHRHVHPRATWLLPRREEESSLAALRPSGVDKESALYCVLVGLLLGLTLAVCLLSVPRVYDALAYHMPRVMHWIQNGSAAFYPTPEPRQNYVSPLVEYVTVQLMLLHHHDSFALVVQWLAYLGTAVAVSLIAREVGLDHRGQAIAGLVAATAPNVVLQAPTALSDLTCGVWVASFVWILWSGRRGLPWSLGAGAALGLAVSAKASAYLFLLPFGLLWLARELRDRRLGHLGAAAVVFVLLNGYHYWQSWLYLGSPVSSGSHVSYFNENLSPRVALSSLVKHLSVHAVLPVTQRPRFDLLDRPNRHLEAAVVAAHRRLGIDPDRNNLPPGHRYSLSLGGDIPQVANSPQSTGSTLHALLVVVAVVALFFRRPRPGARQVALVAGSLAGLMLFGAVFKWQPWVGRFHLPFLVLAAPLVAREIGRWKAGFRVALCCGLSLYAIGLVWIHLEQGLWRAIRTPRRGLYVAADSAEELAKALSRYATVGILMRPNTVEYPFLHFLVQENPGVVFEHAFSELGSGRHARRSRDDYDALLLITQHWRARVGLRRLAATHGYRMVMANKMGMVLARAPVTRGKGVPAGHDPQPGPHPPGDRTASCGRQLPGSPALAEGVWRPRPPRAKSAFPMSARTLNAPPRLDPGHEHDNRFELTGSAASVDLRGGVSHHAGGGHRDREVPVFLRVFRRRRDVLQRPAHHREPSEAAAVRGS